MAVLHRSIDKGGWGLGTVSGCRGLVWRLQGLGFSTGIW
jgi:hypothetical protein